MKMSQLRQTRSRSQSPLPSAPSTPPARPTPTQPPPLRRTIRRAMTKELHDSLEKGNLPKVGSILRADKKLIESLWRQLETPLWIASQKGHTQIVKMLLAVGADVNQAEEDGRTPLFTASWEGHVEVVKLLLAAPGIDVNLANNNGWTPLYWASRNGKTEVVKLLLAAPGIDVNQANNNGYTPLYNASWDGHVEVVKLLLAVEGIDVNQALYGASYQGHVEVVKLLLAAPGIDVNQAANYGNTPLYRASYEGHAEVVKLLLAAPGIDVNQAANDGRTPLFTASYQGHVEVVKLLLAAPGIDVNQANNNGFTPLYNASQEGHVEVVKLLLAVGADVNKASKGGWTPLYMASRNGHAEIVKLLLAAPGIDVNLANNNGDTPLFIASYQGDVEVVKLLLAVGADVNKASKGGWTPLYWASRNGKTEVVKLLLAAPGIDVIHADNDGRTPLFIASEEGRTEIVKLLLAAPGIDVNKANNWAPLSGASGNGRTEVVKLLLAAPGIDVNQADNDGRTPLYWASQEGHAEVVKLLIESKTLTFDTVATVLRNNSFLEGLSMPVKDVLQQLVSPTDLKTVYETKGDLELFKAYFAPLLKRGLVNRLHEPDFFGNSPLTMAISNRWYNIVDYILGFGQTQFIKPILEVIKYRRGLDAFKEAMQGLNINEVGSKNNTALIMAARFGKHELVEYMLTIDGVDINHRNFDGFTALTMAALNGEVSIVKSILTSDAHLDLLKGDLGSVDGRCSLVKFCNTDKRLGEIESLIPEYKNLNETELRSLAKKRDFELGAGADSEAIRKFLKESDRLVPEYKNLGRSALRSLAKGGALKAYKVTGNSKNAAILAALKDRDAEKENFYNKISFKDVVTQEDEITFPVRCLPCKHPYNYESLRGWCNNKPAGYERFHDACMLCNTKIQNVEFMSSALIRKWQIQHAFEANDEDAPGWQRELANRESAGHPSVDASAAANRFNKRLLGNIKLKF